MLFVKVIDNEDNVNNVKILSDEFIIINDRKYSMRNSNKLINEILNIIKN